MRERKRSSAEQRQYLAEEGDHGRVQEGVHLLRLQEVQHLFCVRTEQDEDQMRRQTTSNNTTTGKAEAYRRSCTLAR